MSFDLAPPEAQPGPSISRRRLIQAGAAVGGALWVAPVVESITSSAAAASAPSTGLNFGCSWVYLVWESDSGPEYTGWQFDTNTKCNSDAANPTSHGTSSLTANGVTYALGNASPGPPPITISGPSTTVTLSTTTDGCDNFTYSVNSLGQTVISSGSVTIVAGFSFGGRPITALEPSNSDGSSSITVTC